MVQLKITTILAIHFLIYSSNEARQECPKRKYTPMTYTEFPLLKAGKLRKFVFIRNYYNPNSSFYNYTGPLLKKMFDPFPRLENLLIWHSKISSIEENVFDNLPKLRSIRFQESSLPHVESDAVGNCSVEVLVIWGCWLGSNEMSSSDIFKIFHNLNQLEIAFSPIETIQRDTFKGLGALHYLTIMRTNLSVIENGAFNGLESIRTLSIRFNKLKDVPVEELKKLTTLEYLDLSGNEIENFEAEKLIGSLERLKNFKFSRNKLPCKELNKVKEYLEGRDIKFDAVQEECVTNN